MTRFLLLLLLLCAPLSLQAKAIDADLAIHRVDIDHTFQGLDILLFGARNDAGHIVVLLRGSEHPYIVRKKERVMGIWANTDSMTFGDVPNLYRINSTLPLYQFPNENLLSNLHLGMEHLDFSILEGAEKSQEEQAVFRKALIEHMQKRHLYSKEIGEVEFWGETLFRSEIFFPKKIEGGTYTAETYLINGESLTAMQATPMVVQRIGFYAFLFEVAHEYALLYGLVSVAIALLTGFGAHHFFKRKRRS